MINNSNNRLIGAFCLSTLLFPASYARAALDDFSPYAYVKAVRDNNIFRSSDNEKDDTIGHVGAGVRTDLKLSRQHLLFEGLVDRAQYDNFDELNNTSGNATATWAWEVGNLWSGDLGYTYERELASFAQQLVQEKDMRTTKTGFFKAGYQLHPDWRLAGEVDILTVSYQERDFRNRDTTSGQFDVQYKNTLNTRMGVRVKYSTNDLQETDLGGGVVINNNYEETTVSALFSWEATGKSALKAVLGYTDLSYDEQNDRDFQGVSGRFTFNWLLTGKTKIETATWQETSSLNNEIVGYVLSRGASIKPSWSVTPKITILGEITFENDDFKGANNARQQLGLGKRDDDTWLYRVAAKWDPRRYIRTSIRYTREERDSSIRVRDFDNNRVDVNVRFNF